VLGFDGMKPTVCDKDLCMHSLDQYSLGIDIIDELKNSETFDLLVSMTFLAASMCVATNGTRDVSPSPSRIQELNSSSAMNTANAILDVYAKIPSISQIITECNGDVKLMKKYLDKCHESAFPLIHWIISSNRAYIVPVPTDQKIGQLNGVCEQFILVSSNPEVEGNFRKMRSKFGSFYAFHGSASGNWHSILREGLKILSGTSKMSAGAAYGNGIYTAYEILYLCLETTL
jgi:poly [ADP-ribose] polymerase 6/8